MLGPFVKNCLSRLERDVEAADHREEDKPRVVVPLGKIVPENVISLLESAYRRACARHGSVAVIDRALERGMSTMCIDDGGADALVVWTSVLFLYTR